MSFESTHSAEGFYENLGFRKIAEMMGRDDDVTHVAPLTRIANRLGIGDKGEAVKRAAARATRRAQRVSIPTMPWPENFPKPRGVGGTGHDVGWPTKVAQGEDAENIFAAVTGWQRQHTPGTAMRGHFDNFAPAGNGAAEVKGVSTHSKVFGARPEQAGRGQDLTRAEAGKRQLARKTAWARQQGMQPRLGAVIMDPKTKEAWVFSRPGLQGGRISERTGWQFHGYMQDAVRLAKLGVGGLAMGRMVAEIGERGPEAVIPLNQLTARINAALKPARGSTATPVEKHYHYEPRQTFKNRKDADDANRRGFFQMRQAFR